jgi:hypothetical protein
LHVLPHDVVGKVHAAAFVSPRHVPAHSPPSPAHAGRFPRGAPLLTGEHLPIEPGRSHAWHCPSHGVSQHTPSAHQLLAHSSPDAHVFPAADAPWQAPSTQLPLRHSAAILHAIAPGFCATHWPFELQ